MRQFQTELPPKIPTFSRMVLFYPHESECQRVLRLHQVVPGDGRQSHKFEPARAVRHRLPEAPRVLQNGAEFLQHVGCLHFKGMAGATGNAQVDFGTVQRFPNLHSVQGAVRSMPPGAGIACAVSVIELGGTVRRGRQGIERHHRRDTRVATAASFDLPCDDRLPAVHTDCTTRERRLCGCGAIRRVNVRPWITHASEQVFRALSPVEILHYITTTVLSLEPGVLMQDPVMVPKMLKPSLNDLRSGCASSTAAAAPLAAKQDTTKIRLL